jgi:hypothetical protein
MTLAGFAMPGQRLARTACFAAILLLGVAMLLRHVAGLGEQEEQRAAIARYERIAADLPRLVAASGQPSTRETPDNPDLALALWQSRLAQLAAAQGLQLLSAESQRADGRPAIVLELAGDTPGLLAFLFEVERGTPAMRLARLEIAPGAAAEAGVGEPQLRIRLQAEAAGQAP